MVKHPDELDYIKMELQRLDYNNEILDLKLKRIIGATILLFTVWISTLIGFGLRIYT